MHWPVAGYHWIGCIMHTPKITVSTKIIMQGKLIAVAYTLRTSLGGICKQE